MPRKHHVLMVAMVIVLAAAIAGCATSKSRESTGEYIDDSVITTKVKADLAEDPVTKATQIHVNTYQGVVQLSGFVDNPSQIPRATEVASKVKGVKSVKNDLLVRPPRQ